MCKKKFLLPILLLAGLVGSPTTVQAMLGNFAQHAKNCRRLSYLMFGTELRPSPKQTYNFSMLGETFPITTSLNQNEIIKTECCVDYWAEQCDDQAKLVLSDLIAKWFKEDATEFLQILIVTCEEKNPDEMTKRYKEKFKEKKLPYKDGEI